MLDVPRELVGCVSQLLAAQRRTRGTPSNGRALTCWKQASFVVTWFSKREDLARTGCDLGRRRLHRSRYRRIHTGQTAACRTAGAPCTTSPPAHARSATSSKPPWSSPISNTANSSQVAEIGHAEIQERIGIFHRVRILEYSSRAFHLFASCPQSTFSSYRANSSAARHGIVPIWQNEN